MIDGSYLSSPGWMDRVRRADAIVLVEAPLLVCLVRIIRRSLHRGSVRRSDLPEGCDEHMSAFLLWWTLGWRVRHRGLQARFRHANPDARLIVVKRGDDRRVLVRRLSADDAQ